MNALKYLSPGYMLIYTGTLLFGFTLVPPTIYKQYIEEPDLMFGNFVLYVFLFTCLVFMNIGIGLSRRVSRLRAWRIRPLFSLGPFFYLFMPVCLALALLIITIEVILGNDPGLLVLAISGQGSEVKRAMVEASQGAYAGSLPLAMGMSWWSFAQYLGLRKHMSRAKRVLVSSLVVMLVLAIILAAALMMSRFLLMPTLFGIFIIYLRYKIVEEGIKLGRIIGRAAIAFFLILFVFGLFSALRNGNQSSSIAQSFIGYGPASLNHLAAWLNGGLNMSGLGVYLRLENFGFLYKFPLMVSLLGNGDAFAAAFQSIFTRTWASGLNGSYIWFTSFGEIVAGLNALSVFYILIYGYIVGRFWEAFVKGTGLGFITYPWAAFSLVFSFGSNIFAKSFLSVLLVLVLIMWAYSAVIRVRGANRVV